MRPSATHSIFNDTLSPDQRCGPSEPKRRGSGSVLSRQHKNQFVVAPLSARDRYRGRGPGGNDRQPLSLQQVAPTRKRSRAASNSAASLRCLSITTLPMGSWRNRPLTLKRSPGGSAIKRPNSCETSASFASFKTTGTAILALLFKGGLAAPSEWSAQPRSS